jgi:signal transduction histidine kinase
MVGNILAYHWVVTRAPTTLHLRLYPSVTLEEAHTTNNPIVFTTVVVLIFVFTSAVFIFYDICVERRQRKVMNTAVRSTASVSLLERMVKERTCKLEETNARLAEANRRVTRASAAQLEHFACMSHEIRTPLNCVIGLSSLLLDTGLNPMQEESMRMIVSSGDSLLTVVNDVLDYSKLESATLKLRYSGATCKRLYRLSSTRSKQRHCLSNSRFALCTTRKSVNLSTWTAYDCNRLCTTCWAMQSILVIPVGP